MTNFLFRDFSFAKNSPIIDLSNPGKTKINSANSSSFKIIPVDNSSW
jgi:hypothetical protein